MRYDKSVSYTHLDVYKRQNTDEWLKMYGNIEVLDIDSI